MSDAERSALWTIGYGNRSIAEFLALLEGEHIRVPHDVRSAPYSRFKPEFSKEALAAAVERTGMRYVFMGDLLGGRPDDASLYVDGKVEYGRVAATEPFRKGIGRVMDALSQYLRVCVMCSEGKPEACHRTKLISVEVERLEVQVRHIDADGSTVGQEAVMQRVTGGQQDLFGEQHTSRKRYDPGRAGDRE